MHGVDFTFIWFKTVAQVKKNTTSSNGELVNSDIIMDYCCQQDKLTWQVSPQGLTDRLRSAYICRIFTQLTPFHYSGAIGSGSGLVP